MFIDNQTKLYISVSQRPGNFGATIYNELFHQYEINAVYIPRRALDPRLLVDTIRNLDIQGCSVSMPLKSRVIEFLDDLDPIAKQMCSVNTIVNIQGELKGYNTDFWGAYQVLSKLSLDNVLIYGAGSVANSIIAALKKSGVSDLSIISRRPDQANNLATRFGIQHFRNILEIQRCFDLLINATPASLEQDHELYRLLPRTNGVFDLVVSEKDTYLARRAKELGLKFIPGIEMSKFQLQKQFGYYTGTEPDLREIDRIIRKIYRT